MSSTLIAAIPPQPQCHQKYPFHISQSGQRVAYGCANGVVVRVLPDQVTFDHSPVETYLGSKNPITCAAVSRDSRHVVAGDDDGNCYIWTRSRSGTKMKVVKLDEMQYVRLTDVSISHDSQRIAIVGIDRYSKKLAAALSIDGIPLGALTGPHTRGMSACDFLPSKPFSIVTSGWDGKVCLFDGPPYKLKRSADIHSAPIHGARFSPDSKAIAVVGDKGMVSLLRYPDLEIVDDHEVSGKPSLFDVSWNPRGVQFVVAGGDNKLRIFCQRSDEALELLQEIDGGKVLEDRPAGVVWSPHAWIVTACVGGHVKGWKLPSETAKKEARGVDDLEQELNNYVQRQQEEDDDAKSLGLDSARESERSLQMGRMSDHRTALLQPDADFVWYGPKGNPTAIAFDPNTGVMMVGTTLGVVMFLSTNQTVPVAFQVSRLEKEVTVRSCVLSATCAAAITLDGCLRIYRVRTVNIKGSDAQSRVKHGLEAYGGSTASVFQSLTRQEYLLAATAQVDKTPLQLVFLDNDQYIAVFCTDGSMIVYSVEKALQAGVGAPSLENFQSAWTVVLFGKPTSVCATPDGSLLAVAIWPSEEYPSSALNEEDEEGGVDTSKPLIELYEIDTAESLEGFRFICVLDLFDSEITAVAMNTEGSLLAAASLASREVQVIEIETKELLINREWNYHSTKVTALNWSPDGSKLVSASTNEVFVWDVDCPYSYIPIKAASGNVIQTKFIFNNIVLSASGDGILRVYELDFAG